MAPEWTQIVERQLTKNSSKESTKTFLSLMKLDIYAIGIILSDLLCNPDTGMEMMRIDEALRCEKPRLPKGYKLEGLVEAELMLLLVSPNPDERPTIHEIKENWLPKLLWLL